MMKKNIVIIGLLIGAVALVLQVKNRTPPAPDAGASVTTLSEETIRSEEVAKKPLPRLLDLGAGKCIPCKAMAPILDEMKETFDGQFEVVFIDVWKNESAKEEYGIRMIPTQIFFDATGGELFRHEGFFSREDMLIKWTELGYVFAEKEEQE